MANIKISDLTASLGVSGTDLFEVEQTGPAASRKVTAAQLLTFVTAGLMATATYDAAAIAEQVVGLTATQTLTNKTLTSPIINSPAGLVAADVGLGTTANPQFATIELGHASDTSLARSGAGEITVEGNRIFRVGGADVPLADGGTGASLTDPNADRIMFWDDSAGAVDWLTVGSGLSISGTTLTATGSGDFVGPGSSTDNALVRFDGTTGKLGQNSSGATLSDGFALSLVGGTVTASEPLLNLTQTWNSAGVVFTGILANFTNTASDAASLLLSLQVGGANAFSVDRSSVVSVTTAGQVRWGTTSSHPSLVKNSAGNFLSFLTASGGFTTGMGLFCNAAGSSGVGITDNIGLSLGSGATITWSSGAPGAPASAPSTDLVLVRDAANTLAQRRTTTAQVHRIYRTFTDASNYERQTHQSGAGFFEWAAETAGTGTDDIDLRLTPSTTTAAVDFRNPANGAGAGAGTLTNAPTAGNPVYWLKIKIAGTVHYIPCWT